MSTRPPRNDDQPSEFAAGEFDDRLAAVLRAASAPAHPGELAGEEAAVAAFRAAETAPRQRSPLRAVLAKVLTVKAVIAIAVAGSAGIVVAATGGVRPAPWSAGGPAEQQRTSTPVPAPTSAEPTTRTSSAAPPASPTPATPAILELCRKYAAHSRPDEVLSTPPFRPLVAAAGGADTVADYCAAQARQPSRPDDKGKPDKTGDKGKPDDRGKPGETGKPEDDGKPANTGKPTAKPPKPGGDDEPAMTRAPENPGTGKARPAPTHTRSRGGAASGPSSAPR